MEYQILWEDEALVIVNKPAGLLTIQDGYNPSLPYLSALLEENFGRVWVVHRLDKDTSGAILFARNAAAHKALNTQFEQRQVKKIYHALVVGMPEWETTGIPLPLKIDGDRRHRTVIDHQNGKEAKTEVQTIQRLGLFTLLAAYPLTGYTHQIRAHLAAIGFPVLHDPLYKSLQPETQAMVEARKQAPLLPIRRLALHAFRISFTHPVTDLPLIVDAPYPEDLDGTIQFLSQPH